MGKRREVVEEDLIFLLRSRHVMGNDGSARVASV